MVWKLIEIGLFVIRVESHAYLNILTLLFTLAGVNWFWFWYKIGFSIYYSWLTILTDNIVFLVSFDVTEITWLRSSGHHITAS